MFTNKVLIDFTEKWRMISILSYVIVLIGFGIPIWWHTTRVYRASLPQDDISEFSSTNLYPLQVQIYTGGNETTFDKIDLKISWLFGKQISVSPYDGEIDLPTSRNDFDVEEAAKRVTLPPGTILLVYWNQTDEIIVTSQRVIFFNDESAGYKLAWFFTHFPGIKMEIDTLQNYADRKKPLRPLPAAPNYDVLITVVNPDPKAIKLEWDLLSAIESYLRPFLTTINPIINFTIKSQWMYFVDLGVKPQLITSPEPHWVLRDEILPQIITPIEKKLSSHVSKNPCINFVVYVPPCKTTPLHILSKNSTAASGLVNAFVSPRWGGIQVANPDCSRLSYTPNSELVMSIIVTQLSQLLGLPEMSLPKSTHPVPRTGPYPSLIHYDYLLRMYTLEYLNKSKMTLKSLAQLLNKISNIVINDEVAASVQSAVDNIKAAEEFLARQMLQEAFDCSKLAAISAEHAFTDPSLLALLYFPDDQKYAVYIPLFLPIMIPVFMSLKQLYQYVKKPKIDHLAGGDGLINK